MVEEDFAIILTPAIDLGDGEKKLYWNQFSLWRMSAIDLWDSSYGFCFVFIFQATHVGSRGGFSFAVCGSNLNRSGS